MADTKQKFKNKFPLSLEKKKKKETSTCTIFGKTCYVACAIKRTGKMICLSAYLHKYDHAGLTDKPAKMFPGPDHLCSEDGVF